VTLPLHACAAIAEDRAPPVAACCAAAGGKSCRFKHRGKRGRCSTQRAIP